MTPSSEPGALFPQDLALPDVDILLRGVTEPLLLLDGEGRVLYANQPAAEAVAMPRSEFPGRRLDELFPELDGVDIGRCAAEATDAGTEITASGGDRSLRFHFSRAGGRVVVRLSEPSAPSSGEAGRQSPHDTELLERLVDAIPVMITIWDPHVRVLRFNREFERVLGWTNEDAEREDLMEHFYPDPAYREDVRRYMESLEPGWRDFEVTSKTGGKVLSSWANIRLSDDRRVGIGVDLRERRGTEEALRNALSDLQREHERLRAILQIMPAGVFIADADGRLVETNTVAQEIWGGDTPLVHRKSFDQYKGWFAKSGKRLEAEDWGMAKALAGEEVLDGQEIQIETFDGRRKTILNYALPIFSGDRIEGAVAVSVDVTNLLAAEQALRASEARMATLVESIPTGIGTTDPQGRTISMNAAGLALHGFSSLEEMLEGLEEYQQSFELRYPDQRPMPVEEWPTFKAQRGEVVRDYEVSLRRLADGDEKIISYSVVPLGEGDAARFIFVMHDVTNRKRAEELLRQQKHELHMINETLEKRVEERTADLQERNKELQHFAYIASHDLREPLRKIQAFGGLLQDEEGEKLSEQGLLFVDRMRSAAQRMDMLLNDLLAFSRVTTHARPFAPVRLDEVLSDILDDYELKIRESGAEVDFQATVTLDGDESQLRQLMINLIDNALKFSRPEAAPRVRVRAVVEEDVSGSVSGGEVRRICRVTVEDEGIGFDEKYLDRIFQPFEKLHGRSTYDGAGMGLAICRRIVSRHRGSITAESSPGHGSRFIIELPLRQSGEGDEVGLA